MAKEVNVNGKKFDHDRTEWNEEILETGNEPKKDVDPADETTVSLQTYEAQNAKNEERKRLEDEERQRMINEALNEGPQITIEDDGTTKEDNTDNKK